MSAHLEAQGVTLGYQDRIVIDDLSLEIPRGEFSVIVGPNACGKSTLLRALARVLRPEAGRVLVDGQDIHRRPTREVAREIGLTAQSAHAPEGITVADLVGRGRYPHQRFLRQWSGHDERAVTEAMESTGVTDLAHRSVDELSGGQRQRAWLAMALAQETSILLLDEPTTFLDVTHQLDVLDLCSDLQASGLTLVAVLHDLNQACRYASHLICMRDGAIVAQGPPVDVVTPALVEQVFGLRASVTTDPHTGTPLVLPLPRKRPRPLR